MINPIGTVKSKFTVMIAWRVIAAMLVVMLGMGAGMYVLNLKLKAAKANLSVEQSNTRIATTVANENALSVRRLGEELTACATENVRVNVDGQKAVDILAKEVEELAKESASWRTRFNKAKQTPPCSTALATSLKVCKAIKDY